MFAVFRRRKLFAFAVWLALSAMFVRGLLPFGYMPAQASGGTAGLTLVWCSGGSLAASPKSPGIPFGEHADKCPFAFAAMAVFPLAAAADFSLFAYASEVPEPYQAALATAFPYIHPPARAPPFVS